MSTVNIDQININSIQNELSSSKLTSAQVLIVEDNILIQFIHREYLLELNCDVDTVSSGEEALALAGNGYDLIFLDLGLPDMNGIELAKKLCQFQKNKVQRIIAITAHASEEPKKECLLAGIEQVLFKPIDLESFRALIKK